jgi:hypothetical protein
LRTRGGKTGFKIIIETSYLIDKETKQHNLRIDVQILKK